jgi:hypothetical protein
VSKKPGQLQVAHFTASAWKTLRVFHSAHSAYHYDLIFRREREEDEIVLDAFRGARGSARSDANENGRRGAEIERCEARATPRTFESVCF